MSVQVAVIARNTFTDLVRQKVFYIILVFAMCAIGSSVFMARLTFQEEFQMLKDVCLGAMSIFTSLLAILATANFLPRDLEDRTLYNLLSKPVPRFVYLLGKLAGIILLLLLFTLLDERCLLSCALDARTQRAFSDALRVCRKHP